MQSPFFTASVIPNNQTCGNYVLLLQSLFNWGCTAALDVSPFIDLVLAEIMARKFKLML
jgi:hypothetical protein